MAQKEEWGIQKAVVEWFEMQHKEIADLLVCHQNGSVNYGAYKGKIMQQMGVKRDMPDLQLLLAKAQWHGYFLEVKTKNGYLTKEQKAKHQRLMEQGYLVQVGYGVDDCIALMSRYVG